MADRWPNAWRCRVCDGDARIAAPFKLPPQHRLAALRVKQVRHTLMPGICSACCQHFAAWAVRRGGPFHGAGHINHQHRDDVPFEYWRLDLAVTQWVAQRLSRFITSAWPSSSRRKTPPASREELLGAFATMTSAPPAAAVVRPPSPIEFHEDGGWFRPAPYEKEKVA